MYNSILKTLTSDKLLHFVYGTVLSLPFGVPFNDGTNVILATTIAALAFGVLKELADAGGNFLAGGKTHGVEWLDIVATTIGGTYGGVILYFGTTGV